MSISINKINIISFSEILIFIFLEVLRNSKKLADIMKFVKAKSIFKVTFKLKSMDYFLKSNDNFSLWDNIKSYNILKSILFILLTPIINPLADNPEYSVF